MSAKNDITGDKIKSKPANKAWYESPYWATLDDKLREKEREAQQSISDTRNTLDENDQ